MSIYQSWTINPVTGDYVMTNGSPTNDSSTKPAAYYRLRIGRTQWLYAPDTDYGSDFGLLRKRHTNEDSKILEGIAQRALQPLIDDGRAVAIDVATVQNGRNFAQLAVQITETTGKITQLAFDPLR